MLKHLGKLLFLLILFLGSGTAAIYQCDRMVEEPYVLVIAMVALVEIVESKVTT